MHGDNFYFVPVVDISDMPMIRPRDFLVPSSKGRCIAILDKGMSMSSWRCRSRSRDANGKARKLTQDDLNKMSLATRALFG